ncbi:MAG: glutathionylspermidine synthase family protein [Streptosporangiales bacterium]|nr:glutathionylspermidine synthase family protein [Streptosporangiales bacterium]
MCEIVRTGDVDEDDQPVGDQYFSDPDHTPIDVIFKLFPWEWMLQDEFGPSAAGNALLRDGTVWLEPIWKLLWSNKGILPVLWDLFKDRPEAEFLLEAYFEGEEPEGFRGAVRKPLHGREGANVTILVNNEPLEQGPTKSNAGDDDQDGEFILQRYCPLPEFSSDLEKKEYHPVLGVFTVQAEPVALIIRESLSRITNNLAFAVPHVLTGLE